MLQIHMPQSNRTRAPINGLGRAISSKAAPLGIPSLSPRLLYQHYTRYGFSAPLLAEPDSIPCFG
jgi:hypothetical protein